MLINNKRFKRFAKAGETDRAPEISDSNEDINFVRFTIITNNVRLVKRNEGNLSPSEVRWNH